MISNIIRIQIILFLLLMITYDLLSYIVNAFICINNHVNSCINSMLSHPPTWIISSLLAIYYIISFRKSFHLLILQLEK